MNDTGGRMTIAYIGLLQLQILRSLGTILVRDERLILNTEFRVGFESIGDRHTIHSSHSNRLVLVTASLRIDQQITLDRSVDRHTVDLRTDLKLQFRGGSQTKSFVHSRQELLHSARLLDTVRDMVAFMDSITLVHVVVQQGIFDRNLAELLGTLRNNSNWLLHPAGQIRRQ